MRETREGNGFWQPTLWFTSDFPDKRHFTFTNPWDIELVIESKQKKKLQPHHRHICVTCKLDKQLLRGVSCTENLFLLLTLVKSLGNYPLRRVIAVTLQAKLYLNHSPYFIFEHDKIKINMAPRAYLHNKLIRDNQMIQRC